MKRTILTVAVVCLGVITTIPDFAFARGGSSNNAGQGGGGGRPGGGGGGQGGGGGGRPGGFQQGGGGGAPRGNGGAPQGGGGRGPVNVGGGGGGRPTGNVTNKVNTGVNQANNGVKSQINNQNNQVHLNNGVHHQHSGHRPPMNGSPQVGHHGGVQTTSPSNLSKNPKPNQFNQHHLNNVNLHQHHANSNNNHNKNHNHNNTNNGSGSGNKNGNLNNHSNHNHSNQNGDKNWNKGWNPNGNHANHNHNHNGPNHPFQNNFNHKNFSNHLQFANHQINLASKNYKPAYHNHSQYYHGHWHGGSSPWANNYGYGGYGWNGYGPHHHHHHHVGYQPYYWGLGGWGLGSLIYGSGYQSYYNPYCVSSPALCYNYAQPIPVAYNQDALVSDQAIANTGANTLDSAVAAFKQNNYDAALDLVNKGISETPTDSVLHEFRSLVLFAKGDYQQSAATIHSVLAVGPGWDWTTLSGLYTDVGIYTNQLRALEAATKQNPGDAAQHFLLGYHYMSDGYNDAAAKQFRQVTEIMPKDNVAASMLKMLTTPQQPTETADPAAPAAQPTPLPPLNDLPSPSAAVPAAEQPIAPPVDPAAIVGDWKSGRDDGSKFALSLSADKTFKWTYASTSQPAQDFDGTYTIDGNVIALERAGGGSLVAEIADNSDSGFNFKMVGAPEDDPGLNFSR